MARDNVGSAGLLALALLGPVVVAVVHGRRIPGIWSTLLVLVELALVGTSAVILLAVTGSAFTLLTVLGPWVIVPASGSVRTGVWLALAGNAILVLLCLASVGRQLRARTWAPGSLTSA